MFSGGLGSWAAGKRVAAKYGTEDLTLLFCDTMIEDPDLYRFLPQAAKSIGAPVTRIADGRTPWEVFDDEGILGNSRVDPCSKILKRQLSDSWLRENCDPAKTIIYLGLDWSEVHRFDDGHGRGARFRYWRNGWTARAPMCDRPYMGKFAIRNALAEEGIELPRLYTMGFAHNNCGGFCIKAGQGHFDQLLNKLPDVYAHHERKEKEFRERHNWRQAILRDRRGGISTPLTLEDFRKRSGINVDKDEIGGCGCMTDDN